LIFDEVVTGFRAHPRGVQQYFDIDVDLATYGKVVGGGFPIGVIAGRRAYMDALDGGHWQFGDDSVPTVGVTYFAGTFVRHPLALAAAKAVLDHLAEQGPALQEGLNARTSAMVDSMNRSCRELGRANQHRALRLGVESRFPRRPPVAGSAVRDDAQPRHPHPRQFPLLHDHGACGCGFQRHRAGLSRIHP
jgi:4-aminobutyrate aminotransferase-like enzyme